jgi:GT2 family glycosyltransferase
MAKKAAIIIAFNAWNDLVTNVTIEFLKSIVEKTTYPSYEIVLYENNSKPELLKRITDYIEGIKNKRDMHNCKRIIMINPVNGSWWYNMSREYNDAIKFTDAKFLAFMNNDMKIIDGYWLSNCIRRLEENKDIGMMCPHTSITFGNIIGCSKCSLRHENINLYSCLFNEKCSKRYQPQDKIWFREWAPMGAYVVYRDVLEKVGMHDSQIDLHAQDLSIIIRFEMAGYKTAVAMDSLVDHYNERGHLTLDFLAKDGTDNYDNRSIHSYKTIYDYLNLPANDKIRLLHPGLVKDFKRWYNDFWKKCSKEKMDSYNKWVEEHREEWKNTEIGKLRHKVKVTTYE